jgi:hypothetical protein
MNESFKDGSIISTGVFFSTNFHHLIMRLILDGHVKEVMKCANLHNKSKDFILHFFFYIFRELTYGDRPEELELFLGQVDFSLIEKSETSEKIYPLFNYVCSTDKPHLMGLFKKCSRFFGRTRILKLVELPWFFRYWWKDKVVL